MDKSDLVIDETECTITCTALERDPEGMRKVDEYESCLRDAPDCAGRLECSGSGTTSSQ